MKVGSRTGTSYRHSYNQKKGSQLQLFQKRYIRKHAYLKSNAPFGHACILFLQIDTCSQDKYVHLTPIIQSQSLKRHHRRRRSSYSKVKSDKTLCTRSRNKYTKCGAILRRSKNAPSHDSRSQITIQESLPLTLAQHIITKESSLQRRFIEANNSLIPLYKLLSFRISAEMVSFDCRGSWS